MVHENSFLFSSFTLVINSVVARWESFRLKRVISAVTNYYVLIFKNHAHKNNGSTNINIFYAS